MFTRGLGPDRDGDGLDDGSEKNASFTDPFRPDVDRDGLFDGEEVDGGSDPNNGLSTLTRTFARQALNTNAFTNNPLDRQPHFTTDGAGTWLAVWSSRDDLEGVIGGNSDFQRIGPNDE